jgi:hypothetical protein
MMERSNRILAMALLALCVGTHFAVAAEDKPAAGVKPLEVTYYFLPG